MTEQNQCEKKSIYGCRHRDALEILLNESIVIELLQKKRDEYNRSEKPSEHKSVFTKRDDDGIKRKIRKMKTGEFWVLEDEEFPTMEELEMSTIDAIDEQRQYHDYKQKINYVNSGSTILNFFETTIKYGKWLFPFL
jgi:hypothetical protein